VIASRFKMAVRIQRFEVWACALVVAVVGITALIVRARLEGVGAPVECLTPWIFPDIVYNAARCDPLNEAFFRIKSDEAGLVMNAMNVVPLLVGLLLGVGLVGREIEGGTAPTVWALAGSRRRWLAGRLIPMLVVLFALLLFAAITSDALAAARVPWQAGRPSFDDAGLHGLGVIARDELVQSVLRREFSPFDRSIDTHVCNLRKKIGPLPDGTERIKGVRGIGYLYVLPSLH
jgi:hypothetical protein